MFFVLDRWHQSRLSVPFHCRDLSAPAERPAALYPSPGDITRPPGSRRTRDGALFIRVTPAPPGLRPSGSRSHGAVTVDGRKEKAVTDLLQPIPHVGTPTPPAVKPVSQAPVITGLDARRRRAMWVHAGSGNHALPHQKSWHGSCHEIWPARCWRASFSLDQDRRRPPERAAGRPGM